MTIPYNSTQKENPELADVISAAKKSLKLELNCHAIATVESFDSSKMTVNAKVNYKQTYFERQESGEYKAVTKSYPVLVDCPIISLSGGDAGLTLPITKGDTCMILFNDRDLDNWFAGNNNGPPNTSRLHSFSDGVALIGLRSKQNLIDSYDTERAVLYKGETYVRLGDKVNIENSSENLNDILNDLMSQLDSLMTALSSFSVAGVTPGSGNSSGLNPATTSALTPIQTELSSISTRIGELLE